jgi:hypothetical protein
MAKWYAEIERTDILVIEFDFPDGETPTDEDVMYAAGYVDNHRDTLVGEEKVIYIEKDELDA